MYANYLWAQSFILTAHVTVCATQILFYISNNYYKCQLFTWYTSKTYFVELYFYYKEGAFLRTKENVVEA